MVEAKMSEIGKCLPLFPVPRSGEGASDRPRITRRSLGFPHTAAYGIPLALTVVCGVKSQQMFTTPKGRLPGARMGLRKRIG